MEEVYIFSPCSAKWRNQLLSCKQKVKGVIAYFPFRCDSQKYPNPSKTDRQETTTNPNMLARCFFRIRRQAEHSSPNRQGETPRVPFSCLSPLELSRLLDCLRSPKFSLSIFIPKL